MQGQFKDKFSMTRGSSWPIIAILPSHAACTGAAASSQSGKCSRCGGRCRRVRPGPAASAVAAASASPPLQLQQLQSLTLKMLLLPPPPQQFPTRIA